MNYLCDVFTSCLDSHSDGTHSLENDTNNVHTIVEMVNLRLKHVLVKLYSIDS